MEHWPQKRSIMKSLWHSETISLTHVKCLGNIVTRTFLILYRKKHSKRWKKKDHVLKYCNLDPWPLTFDLLAFKLVRVVWVSDKSYLQVLIICHTKCECSKDIHGQGCSIWAYDSGHVSHLWSLWITFNSIVGSNSHVISQVIFWSTDRQTDEQTYQWTVT